MSGMKHAYVSSRHIHEISCSYKVLLIYQFLTHSFIELAAGFNGVHGASIYTAKICSEIFFPLPCEVNPNREHVLRPLFGTDALHSVLGSNQWVHIDPYGIGN